MRVILNWVQVRHQNNLTAGSEYLLIFAWKVEVNFVNNEAEVKEERNQQTQCKSYFKIT